MAYDALNELNRAAFNSFDPQQSMTENYDPSVGGGDNYDEYGNRKAGNFVKRSPVRPVGGTRTPDAQFDITIRCDDSSAQNVELFNAQNTIAEFANNQWNYAAIPALSAHSVDVAKAVSPQTATLIFYGAVANDNGVAAKVVFYDQSGNLHYTSLTGETVISCKQIPYRSLVKYSERGSFTINKMRMKFTSTNQINNDIRWESKNFLGSTQSNTISVSSYFRPDQFQSLLVDVPVPVSIDAEKGLFYTMNPDETVLINMFVGSYTRSAL